MHLLMLRSHARHSVKHTTCIYKFLHSCRAKLYQIWQGLSSEGAFETALSGTCMYRQSIIYIRFTCPTPDMNPSTSVPMLLSPVRAMSRVCFWLPVFNGNTRSPIYMHHLRCKCHTWARSTAPGSNPPDASSAGS